MINEEEFLKCFKKKFESMTYEERQKYLDSYGFKFEEETNNGITEWYTKEDYEIKKLKSCPFCGGEAKILSHLYHELSNTYGVVCQKCGNKTSQFYRTEEDATQAWNRRVNKNGET